MFRLIGVGLFLYAQFFVLEAHAQKQETFEELQNKIEKQKNLSGRIKEFKSLLGEVKARANDSKKSGKDLTWIYLEGYLGEIEEGPFNSPKKCAEFKNKVIYSFNPKSDTPSTVPQEVLKTLKVLSILCQDDGLARLSSE